jgi:tRNA A37 N6-isopentenylltransferase MiaA
VNYESSRLATIRDGAQAMIGYQDMLHGSGRRSPEVRDNLRHALLEYCKLDTAAMVIIYQQWMGI